MSIALDRRRASRRIVSADRSWTTGTVADPRRVGAVLVVTTIGIVAVAVADILARRGDTGTGAMLFWPGLVAIIAPAVFTLGSRSSTRFEHAGSAVLLGLALYSVKILNSPTMFLFSDEFVHFANAHQAALTGHLFNTNPILEETRSYPGLAAATSAISSVCGLSLFSSGLIVIGCARVILVLGIFLLVENLTKSSRIAGIATLLYAGNPNFVFWSAQYSYQSLALPLAVAIVFFISLRRQTKSRSAPALATAAVLMLALVMTHHLTAYMTAAFVIALATLAGRRRSEVRRALWGLGIYSVVLCVAWLVLVASPTIPYLYSALSRALGGLADLIASQQGTRAPFQASASGGYVTPLPIRMLTAASSFLMLILFLSSLSRVRQRHRGEPFAILLVIAGGAYFGALLLRFAPSAWETGNRASEILFIGLAFSAAIAADALIARWPFPRTRALGFAILATIVIAGGAPAGWSPQLLLPKTLAVTVDGRRIEPPGMAVARWTDQQLGTHLPIVTDDSNGRLLMALAGQDVVAGSAPYVKDLLLAPAYPAWEGRVLRVLGIRYLVVDRRRVSSDNLQGYFFSPAGTRLLPASVYEKYARLGADVVLDGGQIRVYDARSLSSSESDFRPPGARRPPAGIARLPFSRGDRTGRPRVSAAAPRGDHARAVRSRARQQHG